MESKIYNLHSIELSFEYSPVAIDNRELFHVLQIFVETRRKGNITFNFYYANAGSACTTNLSTWKKRYNFDSREGRHQETSDYAMSFPARCTSFLWFIQDELQYKWTRAQYRAGTSKNRYIIVLITSMSNAPLVKLEAEKTGNRRNSFRFTKETMQKYKGKVFWLTNIENENPGDSRKSYSQLENSPAVVFNKFYITCYMAEGMMLICATKQEDWIVYCIVYTILVYFNYKAKQNFFLNTR